MTKKRKSPYLILSGLILLFAFSVYSQITDTLYEDSLCAYTWNSDINDCPDVLDCIYPDKWNDTIIDIQANITHISKDGLKLCLEDLMIAGSAEIIYIMDLSSSMNPAFGANAGDPSKKRPSALQTGFKYQIDSATNSRAGYIGFHSNLQSDQLLKPVAVNNQTGINSLNLMVQRLQSWVDAMETNMGGYGTSYNVAIGEAINYFIDPGITHDSNQAIIFISDGEPMANVGATAAQVQTLINRKISVYGIFLGSNIGTGLDTICQRTGGKSYLVPPSATDTLAKVVKEIVKSLMDPYSPQGLTISNNTTGINGIAVSFQKIADTVWQIVLDNPLPLKPGPNLIQLNSIFSTPSGQDTTLTFKFTLNVGGDTTYNSECVYCWYRTQMDVYVNNVPVDTLTWQNNNYTLKLFYYGEDTLTEVKIPARTVNKGDLDTITITNPTFDGIKWTFSKTVPFAVITGNPTQHNGTTEADFEDLVTFNWRHPKEPMDTAYTSVVVKAPPSRMEIHDKAGAPTAASKYPTSPAFDTVVAGIDADLYAKVFANTKWLSDYENIATLYKNITWKCTDINGNPLNPTYGFLRLDSVAHNIFHPRRARIYVDITATLTIAGLNPISETIRLYIVPGEPTQLVIERTKDPNSIPSDREDYSPIMIYGNELTKTAYAILRDSIGNPCDPFPAYKALWSSDQTSIVTVDPGPSEDGVIHKQNAGQTIIHAVENGLEDTAVVKVEPYAIDSIRIVRVHNYTDTTDISTLVMNTNQDTTLHVIGHKNDNTGWIPIDGDWFISDTSVVRPYPPSDKSNWSFSPYKPDTGIIYATFEGDSNKTLYDTVHYYFSPGAPIQVKFTIITPDSLLIAGRQIKGMVEIINADGHVPGLWKYPRNGGIGGDSAAYYTDILGAGVPGTHGYMPFGLTFDLSGATLDSCIFNNRATLKQWFLNGIDTLTFVLYNTGSVVGNPSPKLHKLTVYLDALSASTKEFILKPGPLDTIVLKPGTLPVMTPNFPSFNIRGEGYDKFWNFLPNDIFTWTNDTTLFDFFINSQSTQIFINPSDATDDQEGWINVKGISDTTVTNKVFMKIIGPKPKLVKAITRDYNGNGFLELIEITLDKPVILPPGYIPYNVIVQKNIKENVFIGADSLTIAPLSNNKKLLLHLSEIESILENVPQTSWTPLLTIADCDSIERIDRMTCEDGAAPVVWSAVKDVKDVNDRKKDVVTITLSEDFFTLNGTDIVKFITSNSPEVVFNAWTTTPVKIDSMFSKIPLFKDQQKNWCVFNMTNGLDLNGNHLVNINHLNTLVSDAKGNVPHDKNQKVRVKVTGNIGDIIVAPIPIIPNLHNFIDPIKNPLDHHSQDSLFNIILNNGGAIITIPIKGKIIPGSLEAALMVFDAAANLVFSQETGKDFFYRLPKPMQDSLTSGEGILSLNFYWSGCSSKGMKAAPGVYRLIVYVTADTGKGRKTSKYGKTVAVGR